MILRYFTIQWYVMDFHWLILKMKQFGQSLQYLLKTKLKSLDSEVILKVMMIQLKAMLQKFPNKVRTKREN